MTNNKPQTNNKQQTTDNRQQTHRQQTTNNEQRTTNNKHTHTHTQTNKHTQTHKHTHSTHKHTQAHKHTHSSHFGSSRCWTSAPQLLEPRWSHLFLIKQLFWRPHICKRGNRCPFVRFGRTETAETASVVSTAETTSTLHASAERTAHLEKVVSRQGSLMSTVEDLWNEALAAGIDGKIKLQGGGAARERGRAPESVDQRVCSSGRQAGSHTGAGSSW